MTGVAPQAATTWPVHQELRRTVRIWVVPGYAPALPFWPLAVNGKVLCSRRRNRTSKANLPLGFAFGRFLDVYVLAERTRTERRTRVKGVGRIRGPT